MKETVERILKATIVSDSVELPFVERGIHKKGAKKRGERRFAGDQTLHSTARSVTKEGIREERKRKKGGN